MTHTFFPPKSAICFSSKERFVLFLVFHYLARYQNHLKPQGRTLLRKLWGWGFFYGPPNEGFGPTASRAPHVLDTHIKYLESAWVACSEPSLRTHRRCCCVHVLERAQTSTQDTPGKSLKQNSKLLKQARCEAATTTYPRHPLQRYHSKDPSKPPRLVLEETNQKHPAPPSYFSKTDAPSTPVFCGSVAEDRFYEDYLHLELSGRGRLHGELRELASGRGKDPSWTVRMGSFFHFIFLLGWIAVWPLYWVFFWGLSWVSVANVFFLQTQGLSVHRGATWPPFGQADKLISWAFPMRGLVGNPRISFAGVWR